MSAQSRRVPVPRLAGISGCIQAVHCILDRAAQAFPTQLLRFAKWSQCSKRAVQREFPSVSSLPRIPCHGRFWLTEASEPLIVETFPAIALEFVYCMYCCTAWALLMQMHRFQREPPGLLVKTFTLRYMQLTSASNTVALKSPCNCLLAGRSCGNQVAGLYAPEPTEGNAGEELTSSIRETDADPPAWKVSTSLPSLQRSGAESQGPSFEHLPTTNKVEAVQPQ